MQAILQNTDIAEQEVRAGVNEKNFFSSMKHLFSSSFTVLSELMQNSRRAGATGVHFEIDVANKSITISDDGCGIKDFSKIIQLCESDWDEQLTLSETPFGMGFFSVFYACENVTIRSNGLVLQAGLDDISNKRALKAVKDENPVTKGAVITLNGVCDKLLPPRLGYRKESGKHALHGYEICHQLSCAAMGFQIPVSLNGVELPRPHAQSNLTGEHTSVGFIQIAHVHTAAEMMPALQSLDYSNSMALYLQGLPIEGTSDTKTTCVIVHLDSVKFIAKMPDRSHLYDSSSQVKIVKNEVKEVAKRFLVTQKKLINGETFIKKYWGACHSYDVIELLNDIPFIPLDKLFYVDTLSNNPDDRWTSRTGHAPLVSRQQILSGAIKVWRHVPEDLDDSKNALILQKVMQRNEISTFHSCVVHEDHWLGQCTPSCNDFVVALESVNPRGEARYYRDNYSCTIKLADSIKVVITSEVDAQFRMEHSITKDWVIQDVSEEGSSGDYEVVCYVTPEDASSDYPVKVFSLFTDEDDHYRNEWEDDAIREWNSLLAGMLGQSLTRVVEIELGEMSVTLSQNHDGQMTLLRTCSYWNDHSKGYSKPGLKAVDLENAAFWTKVAKRLSRKPVTADSLKAAFAAAANSGEKIGGPKAKPAKKK